MQQCEGRKVYLETNFWFTLTYSLNWHSRRTSWSSVNQEWHSVGLATELRGRTHCRSIQTQCLWPRWPHFLLVTFSSRTHWCMLTKHITPTICLHAQGANPYCLAHLRLDRTECYQVHGIFEIIITVGMRFDVNEIWICTVKFRRICNLICLSRANKKRCDSIGWKFCHNPSTTAHSKMLNADQAWQLDIDVHAFTHVYTLLVCTRFHRKTVTRSASIYTCNFAISTREYMLQGLDTKALGNSTRVRGL